MEFINWCAGNTKQLPRLCLVVLVVCRDNISDNEADGFCWTYHSMVAWWYIRFSCGVELHYCVQRKTWPVNET